ncbi:MAG TPA: hypothetical protein V6D23_22190 [Candidatus Obscuribacterales bacterium]
MKIQIHKLSNKAFSRLATSSMLLFLGLPLLTACPPRTPNGSNVGAQSQSRTTLKVRFELSDPHPDYLSKVKKARIKLNSSFAPVDDSFDVSISATTKELERTLSNVPTGQLDAEVHLLDAEGKDVVTIPGSRFTLSKDNTDALLVRLDASPRILPPLTTGSTNLAALRQQRRDLLTEIQALSAKESELLRQLSGLRGSPSPEDQTLRQQLQGELQVTQTQLQTKQNQLDLLGGQLARLESQSSSGSGAVQEQVFQLRLQADQLSSSIDSALSQRRQLSQEINSLTRGGGGAEDQGRLSQVQGELQTLDEQIADQIRQLQLVNLQLQQLESKLSSQSASLPAAESKAQIESDLALLKDQISTLESEIPPLRQRIEALAQATDLQSVQRRETLEAELSQKQADLDRARQLQADLQKQLEAVNS